jgi:hypothetical protein
MYVNILFIKAVNRKSISEKRFTESRGRLKTCRSC